MSTKAKFTWIFTFILLSLPFTKDSSAFAGDLTCRNLLSVDRIESRSSSTPAAEHDPGGERRLDKIRNLARQKGLALVIIGSQVGDLSSPRLRQEIYGGVPVYSDQDLRVGAVSSPGVVFYWGTSLTAKGKINTDLHLRMSEEHLSRFKHDKWAEYQFASSIDASLMPRTALITEIFNSELSRARTEIVEISNENGPGRAVRLQNSVTSFAQMLVQRSLVQFPKGALFKISGEYQTGDKGTILTTANLLKLLGESKELETIAAESADQSSDAFIEGLQQSDLRPLKFIGHALARSPGVLVQEQMKLAQMGGRSVEVRVDFTSGTAISGSTRYGYSYYPEINRRAMDLINKMFSKAPPEWMDLAGAADVALLANGSLKIIEFNFGDRSGFTLPRYAPLASNKFISSLLGKPTWLLQTLTSVYNASLTEQINFLRKQSTQDNGFNNDQMTDIYVADVIANLRDQAIDAYNEGSSRFGTPESVMSYVRKLIDGVRSNEPQLREDLAELSRATEEYLSSKDSSKEFSPPEQVSKLPLDGNELTNQFRRAFNSQSISRDNRFISFESNRDARLVGRILEFNESSILIEYPYKGPPRKIRIEGHQLKSVRISSTARGYFSLIDPSSIGHEFTIVSKSGNEYEGTVQGFDPETNRVAYRPRGSREEVELDATLLNFETLKMN